MQCVAFVQSIDSIFMTKRDSLPMLGNFFNGNSNHWLYVGNCQLNSVLSKLLEKLMSLAAILLGGVTISIVSRVALTFNGKNQASLMYKMMISFGVSF